MEHEFRRSPEHTPPAEQRAEQEKTPIDYSSNAEMEYIAKMLGLPLENLRQLELLSPEMRKLFEQAKHEIALKESLISAGQKKIIKQEIRELFN